MHRFCLALTFLLLSSTFGAVASANLVMNPGFETGDFTSWTLSGNTDFTFVDGLPHSGSFAGWFGPIGTLGFLSQTLTTVPGETYELHYWLQHDPFGSGIPNAVQVFWGGSLLTAKVDVGTFAYTEFVVSDLAATGASTELRFAFREDTDFFQLDDVSVESRSLPVPEASTLLLMGLGLLILVAYRMRLRKVDATAVVVLLIVTVLGWWILGPMPTQAQITDFTPEGIEDFLTSNPQVGTTHEFLQNLPVEFHYTWIMMTNSESAQLGNATSPRFILFDLLATRVFGFALNSQTIEYLQFEEKTNKFRFHEITMQTGGGTIHKDAPKCLGCHASTRATARVKQPRPNWDAYDSWGGALPFNRDRIYQGSEEEKAVKRILNDLKNTDFVRQLAFPPGIQDDVTTGTIIIDYTNCDPQIDTTDFPCKTDKGNMTKFLRVQSFSPGAPSEGVSPKGTKTDEGVAVAMFDFFTLYNARRVAQELADFPRDPVDMRPVALAIAKGCVTPETLGKYAPKAALTKLIAYHTNLDGTITDFPTLRADTLKRMHSLPTLKKALEVENLKGLITANGSMGVDPATEIARRSNQNFPPPPEVFTVDPASGLIDRELYGDEDLKIALFRLFLEPLGVAVDTWSMSVQSFETGAERNLTYTFGDLLLAQYIPRITAKLEADLGGAMTCPQLSAASIKQYVRPF